MTTGAGLRVVACAIGVAAAIDPSCQRRRAEPLPIELRTAVGVLVPDRATADVPDTLVDLRKELANELGGQVTINTSGEPRALLVAGDTISPALLPASIPVSMVADTDTPVAKNSVTLELTNQPDAVLPGWAARVGVSIINRGMTPGTSSTVVLESSGIEVDRLEHRWTNAAETFRAQLTFAPPAPGAFALTARVLPDAAASGSSADAAVETRVVAESRRLRVLAFDSRASWASGFVRRVIEDSADFEVVTRVAASPGLEVRTGAAPDSLTAATLESFDLVLIGGPEQLTTRDVAALEWFARLRGGTVVLLADRVPTGACLELIGVTRVEEVLLPAPVSVAVPDGPALRGSEFAIPAALGAGMTPLATIQAAGGTRAVVVSSRLGAGQVIFSGVLDGWRYRADEGERFAAFWRGLLARGAIRAPRRIELALDPAVARPGELVRLQVRLRASEITRRGDRHVIPAVSSSIVGPDGQQQHLRLWPTAEMGIYEGTFTAPAAGRYDVRAGAGEAPATTAGTILLVEPSKAPTSVGTDADAHLIARATGGVVATRANLQPLREHLRSLPRATTDEVVHPMRSPWWAVAFVALLTSEWALRRRRGLR